MRTVFLVALTMVAFAMNSILNRAAVDGGYADPSAFALVRVLAGIIVLGMLLTVRGARAGMRQVATARWGLIPRWWRKPLVEMKASTFNARSEEAAQKPMFRDAFRHRLREFRDEARRESAKAELDQLKRELSSHTLPPESVSHVEQPEAAQAAH